MIGMDIRGLVVLAIWMHESRPAKRRYALGPPVVLPSGYVSPGYQILRDTWRGGQL